MYGVGKGGKDGSVEGREGKETERAREKEKEETGREEGIEKEGGDGRRWKRQG